MCKTKMAVDASQPVSSPLTKTRSPKNPQSQRSTTTSSSSHVTYTSGSGSETGYRLDTSTATGSVSSNTSLSSLRSSLPENPKVYDFSDIRAATNNFLARRYSATSSSQSWRCTLHGKDVIVFQRRIRKPMTRPELKSKLSVICRSHYRSIVKLLGASISGENVYLVYEFVNGSNLSLCLRNPKNPSFTVLATWMARMQIATDIAHGLDYIHNNATGLDLNPVHKYVKSSGIIVTEPSFNARICHFGAAELCGGDEKSPARKFDGVRGYISPEFELTQKSDVYAFGVVLLELFSGEEPVRLEYDKSTGGYRKVSVIETARDAVESGGGTAEMRVREWVDRRLGDSFPVDVAEKVIRLALDCVHVEAGDRPDMRRVAGKISKLYLESKFWSDRVKMPTEISVSLAAR